MSTGPGSKDVVYIAMVGDILHAGHINIIRRAQAVGEVIVGLLTDSAAASYKRVPLMGFEERKLMLESLKGILRVVPQTTLSYRENLLKFRPKYVIHGDDWRQGVQLAVRREVLDTLREWGGELIEIPYTPGVSSTLLQEVLLEQGVLARFRQVKLRKLFETQPLVRVIEVHSAMAGVVAERAKVNGKEFDAFWSSSLSDSIIHGKPDIEVVDYRTRIAAITELFEVTTKPLIYDGDSGRSAEHVYHLAQALDAAGVSALCLEDKTGQKLNSLYGTENDQPQASIQEFSNRLGAIRKAAPYSNLMSIARIESLVLGRPLEEALERADAYCEAQADAILIHSVKPQPDEIFAFAARFKQRHPHHLLVVVPTAYCEVYEADLASNGIDVVIYANHLIRASYAAMERAANDILAQGRSFEACADSATPAQLLKLFVRQNQ